MHFGEFLVAKTLLVAAVFANLQGGPKTGPFLNLDNFPIVSGTKVCDMSKVCKFCLEKNC